MKPRICDCGKEMLWDYGYSCYECNCGNCCNAFGQKLRPKEDWQEEYDEDY